MYIYVGKLTCSGKLDNGKDWAGLRLAAGVCNNKGVPYAVKVYKVANDSDIHSECDFLEPGEPFTMTFDEKGRVVHVEML